MKIITLLTDFGSFYPAQMKGVILTRLADKAQDITFVDIAHDIPPQDVRAGAFALLSSVRYFPRGSIHICVVDPGVGTDRMGLVVESGGQIFVGPDNGLLIPAAQSVAAPGNPLQAYKIAISQEILGAGLGSGLGSISNTFHGRDIFAPVVALLASGKSPAAMGPKVRPKDLNFAAAKKTDKGWQATVIYVDRFGNLILNMRNLPATPVSLKGIKLKPVRTYAQARRIEPLITQGSHGYAEIAVNQGNAAEAFCLKAGDRIELEEI
ncbi:MAG: SAM-dependent chlorinase/fluorinase [Methanothrix sp.]|nr:SAM-dependent chlorinase/fluorinase [Methanothrix sp.]MDD4447701.1 SAM-dependent chlorinase/fluorinase [Methanothrix sp.]